MNATAPDRSAFALLLHASATQRFAAVAFACAAAVSLALVGQHVYDLRPCPWCIVQRLIYVALGVFALLGALLASRPVRFALAGGSLLLAVSGAAAAIWHSMVASKSTSCNLTLADKVLNALGVETLWPSMFQVTASCAGSAVRVLGLYFEQWSLLLFLVLAVVAASTLLKLRA